MVKKSLFAVLLSGLAASAQAGVLVQEGFDNIASLAGSGWVAINASTPGGSVPGWFQGDQQVFAAQSGPANSYIAANYDNAPVGGTIDNWLLTPIFSTATGVDITLWLRGAQYPGYFDQVALGFSHGGILLSDFAMSPVFTVATDEWTRYTVHLDAQGAGATGRFAIQYTNAADASNYVGLDNLRITEVPEPATLLILASGLAGLAATRRRQRR